MKNTRPFDALANATEQTVEVELKNSQVYKGKLTAFDVHLNIVLEEAVEVKEGEEKNIGKILLRGDALVTVKNL